MQDLFPIAPSYYENVIVSSIFLSRHYSSAQQHRCRSPLTAVITKPTSQQLFNTHHPQAGDQCKTLTWDSTPRTSQSQTAKNQDSYDYSSRCRLWPYTAESLQVADKRKQSSIVISRLTVGKFSTLLGFSKSEGRRPAVLGVFCYFLDTNSMGAG